MNMDKVHMEVTLVDACAQRANLYPHPRIVPYCLCHHFLCCCGGCHQRSYEAAAERRVGLPCPVFRLSVSSRSCMCLMPPHGCHTHSRTSWASSTALHWCRVNSGSDPHTILIRLGIGAWNRSMLNSFASMVRWTRSEPTSKQCARASGTFTRATAPSQQNRGRLNRRASEKDFLSSMGTVWKTLTSPFRVERCTSTLSHDGQGGAMLRDVANSGKVGKFDKDTARVRRCVVAAGNTLISASATGLVMCTRGEGAINSCAA